MNLLMEIIFITGLFKCRLCNSSIRTDATSGFHHLVFVVLFLNAIKFLDCSILIADDSNLFRPDVDNVAIYDQPITQADRIVLNEYWNYGVFPGLRVPVFRAPHRTFGMPWPLPQFWTATQCFYKVDVDNFRFGLDQGSNSVLQSAIIRYTHMFANRIGLSSYSEIWRHDEELLNEKSTSTDRLDETSKSSPFSCNQIGTAGADPINVQLPTGGVYDQQRVKEFVKKFQRSTGTSGPSGLASVHLSVLHSESNWPHLYMDESYTLAVCADGIFILANETWGALRAFETLSQLLWTALNHTNVFINQTFIEDYPRFKHRGILIDTSRHFISKEILLLNLEAMSYNKMNVFHWHIVDDQSFPYQSELFPELSAKGAYRKDYVYTVNDIKEIVEFARLRGIRVIPELDIPGHTLSLSWSHPELLSKCYSGSKWFGHFGPMNPARNETYIFLERLFDEISSLFPETYVHLGGDEVETLCWESDLQMVSEQKNLGFSSASIWNDYFWRRVQNLITEMGMKKPSKSRNLIVWQDMLSHVTETKKSLLVQIWSSSASLFLSQGYNVIYSTCWYLDTLTDIKSWTLFYMCDPARDATASTEHQIIGGEACMWTEYQSDFTILSRIWPITSAVAERLWSSKSTTSLTMLGPRIEEQRCRLINRGITAGVLLGPGNCDVSNPTMTFENTLPKSKLFPSTIYFRQLIPCVQFRNGNWLAYLLTGLLLGVLITLIVVNRSFIVRKFNRGIGRRISAIILILFIIFCICLSKV